MARDRKRARQRRQRQARQAPQSPRTSEPFVADDEPTTVPPDPVEEASGPAEEAKLAAAGVEPVDADHVDAGALEPDEAVVSDDELAAAAEAAAADAPPEVAEDELAGEAASPGTAPRRRARERSRDEHAAAPRDKGTRFGNFLRACWTELQRVQWPNRPQVFQATGVVLGFVVIAGSYLGLADAVFSRIVNAIL